MPNWGRLCTFEGPIFPPKVHKSAQSSIQHTSPADRFDVNKTHTYGPYDSTVIMCTKNRYIMKHCSMLRRSLRLLQRNYFSSGVVPEPPNQNETTVVHFYFGLPPESEAAEPPGKMSWPFPRFASTGLNDQLCPHLDYRIIDACDWGTFQLEIRKYREDCALSRAQFSRRKCTKVLNLPFTMDSRIELT